MTNKNLFDRDAIIQSAMTAKVKKEWNLEKVREEILKHGIKTDDYTALYIGNILAISPSGKYYTPWACSNVSRFEALLDEYYWDILEKNLNQESVWIDFDALEVFFCTRV